MYYLPIIIPFLFLGGSLILLRKKVTMAKLLMVFGFFLVGAVMIIPLVWPSSMGSFSDEGFFTPSSWEKMQIYAHISTLGSILSCVGFLWYSISEIKK